MKDPAYVAEFVYEGPKPNGYIKAYTERVFVDMYNQFCEQVNPLIARWNNEYTGPDDGINPDGQYMQFMHKKYQGIIDDKINPYINIWKPFLNGNINRFFIGDELTFCAELDNGTTISLYLKAA